MRKSRFSDSQILVMLKQNGQGLAVGDICLEQASGRRSFKNVGLNLPVWMAQ